MEKSRWRSHFLFLLAVVTPAYSSEPARITLRSPWNLQSSCQIRSAGAEISTPGFNASGWHTTEVPSTVVAALVADKTYPDPYFGMNMRSLPGVNYRIGGLFSNLSMPDDSPFRCSWWYRTEFTMPASSSDGTVWLHLDGINYRANVWLNGEKLADASDVVGSFRVFEFDASKLVRHGKTNALAVEVFAPEKDSLAITWVDWNPAPPDKDMGLWKDVYLTTSGPVSLRHSFVSQKLDAGFKLAALTISADLRNSTGRAVKGVLKAEIGSIRVSQPVELGPSEAKTLRFEPGEYSRLKIENPRLWWPYQMGAQSLYTAKLEFESGGRVSDTASVRFGIREVKSAMTETGVRLFRINGKRVLIRGAAYSPDMLLRRPAQGAETALRYVRDMNLNAIRLEGKMEPDEFFDMADQMGILIMPGWCCCDFWERWRQWQPEHYRIAGASMRDQLGRLRNHPSVFVWLYASDGPPPADVEKMYLGILKDEQWPNPWISSAAADPGPVTGPSGVKMPGPYDYEPPNYWLVDKQAGGAYGFNTETSPGPAIPPLESLKRFIPPDHLWPIDEVWNYHAGGERFANIKLYLRGLEERYGKSGSLEDFLRKSQAMAYEGQRAMFEAYGRNKYKSTGLIQWMLNNAWPSLIWHLYDYYLVPAGGYYGSKKGCELVHVQYSYDDNSVAVVNGRYAPLARMSVSAKIYNLDLTEKYSHEEKLDVPADSSAKACDLPSSGALSTTYFLRLDLHDAAGKLVSDNFYWLSTKPDVLDWKKRRGTAYTPQAEFGDLTGLNSLSAVKLTVHKKATRHGDGGSMQVTVRNPSKGLAFMVRLRVIQGKRGEDVVPIFWDDNYFSLLPEESREVTGRYDLAALGGEEPELEVTGWNVAE